MVLVIALGVAVWFIARSVGAAWGGMAVWAGVCGAVLLLLLAAFERACAECELNDTSALVRWGVLRRTSVELPLSAVREVIVSQSLVQRFLGVGNVLVGSGGTSGAQVIWPCVEDPHAKVALVRGATERASQPVKPATTLASGRPLLIGISGGIGAGKSTVARAFERLGCPVVDSDEESRRVLNLPETLRTLQEWWGPGVVKGGEADRPAIAKIVFNDPEQRQRLEGLVHPQVHSARASAVGRAARERRPAVIVDAPLLYEAGVDKECDAVVFVDAPRELRLERVRTRGWDEQELTRRESTQLSLEEKRRRADAVVRNDATPEELDRRVREVLRELLAKGSRPSNGAGRG